MSSCRASTSTTYGTIHVTHLLAEGWPIPTVSRRLGHANPGITMTIYAHALSDVRDDAVVTPRAFAFEGAD